MSETPHRAPTHHSPAYETTDANVKQISIWTVGIFVTIFGGMLAMLALITGFLKFPVPLDRTPTAAEMERTLPPAPRLQVNQAGDLQQFREREEHVLTTYGREPNSGAVRIPVDRAIEIVAAKGALPGARVAAAPKAEAARK